MRVLTVGNETVRKSAHTGTHIGMEVEHAEEGHVRRPGQCADPSQKFALRIIHRLRGHCAVQYQVDCVHSLLERGGCPLHELNPEAFEGSVRYRATRHPDGADCGQDLPVELARRLEKASRGRFIALFGKQISTSHDLHRFPSCQLREKCVRLVKKRAKENPRFHWLCWLGIGFKRLCANDRSLECLPDLAVASFTFHRLRIYFQ